MAAVQVALSKNKKNPTTVLLESAGPNTKHELAKVVVGSLVGYASKKVAERAYDYFIVQGKIKPVIDRAARIVRK